MLGLQSRNRVFRKAGGPWPMNMSVNLSRPHAQLSTVLWVWGSPQDSLFLQEQWARGEQQRRLSIHQRTF